MGNKTEDWAYLAGLFDGEGGVTVSYKLEKGRSTMRVMKYVSIANSDEDIIDWILAFVGFGGKYVSYPDGHNGRLRAVHIWRVANTEDMLTFLRGMQPWSRIKARHIDLAISILESRQQSLDANYHAPVDDWEFFLMEELGGIQIKGRGHSKEVQVG